MSKPTAGIGGPIAGAGVSQGLTATAAAAAAQRQRALLQRADTEINSLLDNFSHLLKAARISSDAVRNAQEVFQMEVHASRVVQAADLLLKLVSELKQTAVFSDFLSLNKHVEQRVARFNDQGEETEKMLSTIGEQAAASLKQLESHYYQSTLRSLEFAGSHLRTLE